MNPSLETSDALLRAFVVRKLFFLSYIIDIKSLLG